jgi:arabinofuranosyltransferase
MEPPPPGRPGHEKEYHLWWLLARYGAPELTEPGTQGPTEPDLVAASREALSCGAVAELVAATNDPLTWNRFWANLTGSVERTSMRIPVDPFVAVEQYC